MYALGGDGVKELQDDLIEQTINPREVYLYKLLQKVYESIKLLKLFNPF